MKYFQSMRPRTKQVVLPGINHLMQMRDPQLVAVTIVDFISRRPF